MTPGYGTSTPTADPNLRSATLQTEPKADVTDTELYHRGFVARGKIKGTEGEVERLDRGKL